VNENQVRRSRLLLLPVPRRGHCPHRPETAATRTGFAFAFSNAGTKTALDSLLRTVDARCKTRRTAGRVSGSSASDFCLVPRVPTPALSRTIHVQLQNFQIHFMKRSFRASGTQDQIAGSPELPFLLRNRSKAPQEEVQEMRARPEVKEILIRQKLLKWASIGKNPSAYPNHSCSRARRNYARLFARHEEVARRLGLTTISAYPRI
jgi:hypothetical protein